MTRLSLSLPASKITDLRLGNPGWVAVFVDAFPPRLNPDTGLEERQFLPDSGTDKGAPTVMNLGVLDADSEMWVPVEGRGASSYFRVGRGSGASAGVFSIETALFDGSNRLTELGADGVQITEVHDLGAVKPVMGYGTPLVSGTFALTGSGYVDLGVTLPALGDDELFLVEITGKTRGDDISQIVSGRWLKRVRPSVAVGGSVDYGADVRVEGPGEQPFYFCELTGKNLGGSGDNYWNDAFGGSVSVLIKRIGN